jgi:hypothetical protein
MNELERRVKDLEAQVKRLMEDLEKREQADRDFADKITGLKSNSSRA